MHSFWPMERHSCELEALSCLNSIMLCMTVTPLWLFLINMHTNKLVCVSLSSVLPYAAYIPPYAAYI